MAHFKADGGPQRGAAKDSAEPLKVLSGLEHQYSKRREKDFRRHTNNVRAARQLNPIQPLSAYSQLIQIAFAECSSTR
jgi:hypothetical protein